MTVKELLRYFENYYGEKYTGVLFDTMTNYFEGCSEKFLSAVGKVMILRFSRIYNKVPGPAEIEKNMDEILDSMPKPKALPEPDRRATPEETEKYLTAIKNAFHPKKGKQSKMLVQEGNNYCMRTAQELAELQKNSNYNGVVINTLVC